MPRNWRFAPHDEAAVGDLCRELRVAPLVAQVLAARGYTGRSDAGAFLNPKLTDLHDPDQLPGVADAADRIIAAIREKRRITIYGDYDVDGMTATSILWQCLKLEDAKVAYYIPCRFDEGYGLNAEALRNLHEEDPQQLVISVDCGITAVEEAALARELGLELIITDHHQMKDTLPDAASLVHPRLPGSDYPFGELCGAGVAFKLAWAICRRLGDGKNASPPMREFLKSAVGLAAIATVADVVPLNDENRVIVRYGLDTLLQLASPGLKSLMQIAEVAKNGSPQADDDVSFKIAPRLNAAGRLGQARLAVELLTTHDPERAMTLAKYLDQLNKNRRTVETRISKRAKALVAENPDWEQHNTLVLAHRDWHPGVIGIVANRIAEQFEKPTVMISLNGDSEIGQGSARTFGGVDLHAALAACSHRLEGFGGHKAAAGLRIRLDAIDSFREELHRHVADTYTSEERESDLQIDAEVRLADVTVISVRQLDRLGPFGEANPRPLFSAAGVSTAEPPKRMGEGKNHLSLRLRHHGAVIRAVAFGRGEWADEIAEHAGPLDVCFAPVVNTFRGQQRVELMLKDWRPSSAAQAVDA